MRDRQRRRINYINNALSVIILNYCHQGSVRKEVKRPTMQTFHLLRCVARTGEAAMTVNYSLTLVCVILRNDFELNHQRTSVLTLTYHT